MYILNWICAVGNLSGLRWHTIVISFFLQRGRTRRADCRRAVSGIRENGGFLQEVSGWIYYYNAVVWTTELWLCSNDDEQRDVHVGVHWPFAKVQYGTRYGKLHNRLSCVFWGLSRPAWRHQQMMTRCHNQGASQGWIYIIIQGGFVEWIDPSLNTCTLSSYSPRTCTYAQLLCEVVLPGCPSVDMTSYCMYMYVTALFAYVRRSLPVSKNRQPQNILWCMAYTAFLYTVVDWVTHSFTHSLTHSRTHSLIHALTHSRTHSRTR